MPRGSGGTQRCVGSAVVNICCSPGGSGAGCTSGEQKESEAMHSSHFQQGDWYGIQTQRWSWAGTLW